MNEDENDRKIEEFLEKIGFKKIMKPKKESNPSDENTFFKMRSGARIIARDFKQRGATKSMFMGAMNGIIRSNRTGDLSSDAYVEGIMVAVYEEAWDEIEKEIIDDIE